jgi:dUTP pyrophosphatase
MSDMKDLATVKIVWEKWADQSQPLPRYETAGAAGADLRANLRPEDRATGLTRDSC